MLILLVLSSSLRYESTASATSPAQRPNLGTAVSFGVLSAGAVSNTGTSNVAGNIGVDPSAAVVGFPPGVVTGTIFKDDAAALEAEDNLTSAYSALESDSCNGNLTHQNLAGLTLTPGVYCYSSAAALSGTLTLNTEGNPMALYVFQIAGALTTSSNSAVVMTSGSGCNVFWQVGGAAVLGTKTSFAGSIFSVGSITMAAGTNSTGAVMTQDGSVAMNTNNVGACGHSPAAPCQPAIQQTYDSMRGTTAISNALHSSLYSQGVASYYQPTYNSIFQIDHTISKSTCAQQVESYNVVFLLHNSTGSIVANLVITESEDLSILGSLIQADNRTVNSNTINANSYAGYSVSANSAATDNIYSTYTEYIQPTVSYPSTGCGTSDKCYVSSWTGLTDTYDSSGYIAQDGTTGECHGSGCTPEYGAWYEETPNVYQNCTAAMGGSVNPSGGDLIYASVVNEYYNGGSDTAYDYLIQDEYNENSCMAPDISYSNLPSPTWAEYITELPAYPNDALAKFGSSQFEYTQYSDWNAGNSYTIYGPVSNGWDTLFNFESGVCDVTCGPTTCSDVTQNIATSTVSASGIFTNTWDSSANTPGLCS